MVLIIQHGPYLVVTGVRWDMFGVLAAAGRPEEVSGAEEVRRCMDVLSVYKSK